MKAIFKIALYLIVGGLAGYFIAMMIIALIGGEPITSAFYANLGAKGIRLVYLVAVAFVATVVGFMVQIIIHEGGHLVAGLLTGYKFVSVRFLSYTLIRKDGRLQWRKFDLAGTGGQCLMAPPDKPIDQIDTRWYNAGGVLANILLTAIGILLLVFVDMPSWLSIFWAVTCFMGFYVALINGIPMKLGGVANDGSNLFQLEKDLPTKQCFCTILESNALNQEGVPFDKMPDRLFELPQPLDWENSMHVGVIFPAVTRMMAQYQWEEAYQLLTEACSNKDVMMELYQHELEALMTLVCIAMGREDEARQHYSKKVAKHVNLHASTQSDKQLDAMAVVLALDKDRPAAEKMYHDLKANRDKYIHQSDVALSLELMQWLLDNKGKTINTTNTTPYNL